MRRLPALLVLLALAAGCGGSGRSHDPRPQVVAAAYPFAWLADRVGGSDIRLVSLAKPGVEPHDLELSPRQAATTSSADVVLRVSGFQPAVDDAVAGGTPLDLGMLRPAGNRDPHVWLDPTRMMTAAKSLAAILGTRDPAHRAAYTARADAVVADLTTLDRLFATALASCRSHDVVTSHAAFGYLAADYGLVQHGIVGLSPDAEPSPRDLAQAAQFARAHHVRTIFFERLLSPTFARTVAEEVGAKTAVLDPVESVSGADDYLSVMRRNAATLHAALGCT